MKLTKRQKRILFISALLFFLALTTIVSIVLVMNKSQKKVSSPIPRKNNSPTDKSSLTKTKTETIVFLKQKLGADNIRNDDLLQELKNNYYLNADETDWKAYLNEATTPAELETRKKKLLDIVEKLIGGQSPPPITPIPSPTPTPLSPDNPPDSPPKPDAPPDTPRPTVPSPTLNKWEIILGEIRDFLNTNPKDLQEIKDWVNSQNYSDPLAGVDLKGAEIDVLKGLPDSGKISGLDKVLNTNLAFSYKDYVQLSATGDGNCFLNSFSVFLTGKNCDTSLSLPLRVKFCLELMTNPDKFVGGNETQQLEELKRKLIEDGFAINGKWLENYHIVYMAPVLKRNITLVTVIPDTSKHNEKDKFSAVNSENLLAETGFTPTYSERWVVYNSGNHFQPLIKK